MKNLKNCVKLSCSVRIFVPSTINVNQSIDSQKYVEQTLRFLSEQFGGATASKALGAWVSANGDLVTENVTIAFSFCNSDQLEHCIQNVYGYCLALKHELSQEAIALEINNELHLV